MKIGFIGLGRMGAPMVRNIARSGAELMVWDVSPNAVQALVADGAHAGESAAHVTSKVDILFTSLPGPVESEAVVFGPAGILESVRPGQVYFDLSTNSLALIRRIHNAFAERGAAVLDAPLTPGSSPSGLEAIRPSSNATCPCCAPSATRRAGSARSERAPSPNWSTTCRAMPCAACWPKPFLSA